MLKIRRPLGRLIFNMGITIPGKTIFLIEMAPRERVTERRRNLRNIGRKTGDISKHFPYSKIIMHLVQCVSIHSLFFNTVTPRQNGSHFAEGIFLFILFYGNYHSLILITLICVSKVQISLKFVPKGQINDKPALIQIMAWHRTGDRTLYVPIIITIIITLMHICVTQPQGQVGPGIRRGRILLLCCVCLILALTIEVS